MLTALLRWMNQSRRDLRSPASPPVRSHRWRGDVFGRLCETLLSPSLRSLWNGRPSGRALSLESFEDRLLFNAAPAPLPAPVASEVITVAPLNSTGSPADVPPPPAAGEAAPATTGVLANRAGDTSATSSSAGATLIVVDPTVPDYESLLSQLTQLRTEGADILVLDPQRDGLEQIAQRLELLGQTKAIHILSHGDEAGLHLGSNWLSANTLSQRANTLAQWKPLLTENADVLFYGCDLAANPAGQQFLQAFGEMTGADVAASTNATGAADLGGDWKLEYQYGSIETPSLGDQVRLFDWEGLLTANSYQQGTAAYTGTVDTSITATSPGTSNGLLTTVTVGGPSAHTGLIRFDNLFGNGAGQIPLGSTITSASLQLNVTSGTAVDSTIALHRVLTTWTSDSTWTSLGGGLTRDGVEVSTVADALVTGTTATGTKTVDGLQNSLQAWSNGEANNGWALYGDNATNWSLTSANGATVAQRPLLIVSYTPPVATGVQLLDSNEVRVNTTTTNTQNTAVNGRSSHDAVGVAADGSYVVVWTGDPGDGNGTGVFAQRYNARNVALDNEFQVNTYTSGDQRWASVAMRSDGGFIVTWTSLNQDGSGEGVYARVYSSQGVPNSEFQVSETSTGTQRSPSIGVDAAGNFVIAWDGSGSGDTAGIFARIFASNGSPQGSEFRVNATTANTQYDPAIAVGQDGHFMVVWDDSLGAHGRRFNASGTALDASDLTLQSEYTAGNADVATNGTGSYHIVWRTSAGGDGSGRAIWGLSLASTDVTPGPATLVANSTINSQTEPSIASDVNGDYIVAWQGSGPGDTSGVFARKFTNEGVALGAEYQLNQTTAGNQASVSVAMLSPANYITVWSGNVPGDTTGVAARTYGTLSNDPALVFTTAGNVTASGSTSLTNWTNWTTGDVLSLGQSNLALGSTTTGTLSIAASLASLGDGNVTIDGLNVVQHDVLVGSGANTVQIKRGDILFSTAGNETFGSLNVTKNDVVVYRPDSSGNFASGTFFILFQHIDQVPGNLTNKHGDFDLIEKATQVGDVQLQAGDLVISNTDNSGNSIVVLRATGAGVGVTGGTVFTLLKGSEFRLTKEIQGIQVIEQDTLIGGVQLRAGNLLVSTDQATTLGSNSLAVTNNDITQLVVTTTSVNGPASVTANLLVNGSDVALDTAAEAIHTISLTTPGTPPTAHDETYTLNANQSFDSNGQWYDTRWSARTQLTFDNSARAENLTDFPVLVTLDPARFDYSKALSNGADLRFVDASGTLLSYEIETWNPNGRSSIWVKVPQIDASSATDSMWMYYGNSAAADAQNSAGVWSNGYAGVWHLNNNPVGTQTILDSTGNNKDGTTINMDASNQINGPIGGGLNFDGTSEAIRIASNAADSLAINGNHLTIEAWANSTGDHGTWEALVNRRSIGPLNSYALLTKDTDQSIPVYSSELSYTSGTSGGVPNDRWRYLTGVTSGTAATLYVDGGQDATQTISGTINGGNNDVTIGAGENGFDSTLSQYWQGGLDEIRISNVARSAAWVSAQYASMTDTLISFGAEQSVAGLLSNDQSATSGTLTVTDVDLSSLSGFATAVVQDNGQIIYTPGAGSLALAVGQTVTKDVPYTVTDSLGGTATATAHFVITGTNAAPAIATNAGLTVNEGAASVIGSGQLAASDRDTSPSQLTYTITTPTLNGQLERVATPGVAITTFTQADINSKAVQYVHDAGETTFDSFGFALSDRGTTLTGSFFITVTPVNDAPVVSTNVGLTLAEGGSVVLSSSQLSATDSDNTPTQLTYTISTTPVNGRIERVSSPGVAITSFTQSDLNGSAIRYVHNGGETTSDSFSFSLSDGTATVPGSVAITVTPVNDPPVIGTNLGLTVAEGGTASVTSSRLSASDPDNTPAQLVYTVTTSPAHGHLERAASPGAAISTLTQADLNSGTVRYVHDGSETTSDAFSFSLSDGTATVIGTFAISVTPVNDAPVVNVNTGKTLAEGTSALISSSQLFATDPDNTPTQLVYTVSTAPANGRLERVAAPGVAITSFTQADLNSGAIRYIHNGSETTSDALSFSLSDGALTVAGSFAITVTPVNDPPVLTVDSLAISEGATVTLSASQFNALDP